MINRSWGAALSIVMSSALIAWPVTSNAADDFYKGKTIKLVVGYSSAGGHDLNARLLAGYVGRHIPGNPNVIVSNMPGASSLKSVQYLDSGAPKDGTVITAFTAGLIAQSQTSPDQFPVRLTNYSWLGSLSEETRACYMWSATGVKTWDQVLKKDQITFGESGTGSAGYIDQRILKTILGVNLKTIIGYPGAAEKRMSIERGELDGDCISYSSVPVDWLRDKKVNIFLRSSAQLLPGMPAEALYILDVTSDPEKKKTIEFLLSPSTIGRPYIVSKQVPADRLQILRNAFQATLKDPQFLAESDKGHMTPVGPMSGEEVEAYVARLYEADPNVLAAAKEIMGGS